MLSALVSIAARAVNAKHGGGVVGAPCSGKRDRIPRRTPSNGLGAAAPQGFCKAIGPQ
jgi:hypothetical protein